MSLKFNRKKLLHYAGGMIYEDSEYEAVEFTTSDGISHQLVVRKGLSDGKVLEEIGKYLYGYESEIVDEKERKVKIHVKGYYDYYPKTKGGG